MAKTKTPPAAPVAGSEAVREAVEREDVEFPCAMYRKRKVSEKHPFGYETRRVESPADLTRLGTGWKTSPAGMEPPPPDVVDDDE